MFNVTNMNHMFKGASTFSQDLSSWNTASVTNMNGMFGRTTNFNGDISTWNVSKVTNMSVIFEDASAFSAANYDKLLDGWSKLSLQNNISFRAPPNYHCNVAARNILIDTYGWSIFGDTEGTNTQCNPTP